MRSSTKILIGAILVAGLGFILLRVVPTQLIIREQFEPIQPGEVNIIGLDTTKGYYIVVANQVAQLVYGEQAGFEAPDMDAAGAGGGDKLRIPLRDMLRALQGDEKSLGKFVMVMNKINDSELPAYPIVWKSEDIESALSGDAALAKKLVADLNIQLDGTPLEVLRFGAVQEGIVIESPVTVEIKSGASSKKVTGRIREEFRPRFLLDLDKSLAEKSELTKALIRGYYIEAAQKLHDDPKQREDIRKSLRSRYDAKRLEGLTSLPQRLLNSITVIVNDRHIEDGRYSQYQANDEKPKYDMTLTLNEEGRKRLWKHSATHLGEQLLVVWDGIAIAAPRIQQAIPFSEVQIKQITDQGLVEDTIDAIKRLKEERTANK